MGSNYYWVSALSQYANGDRRLFTERRVTGPEGDWGHIGKRSAAGPYCWDCMVSFAIDEHEIHNGVADWLHQCRLCGASQASLFSVERTKAADMELGWAADRKLRPHGAGSASSFTWAQDPVAIIFACHRFPNTGIIRSEYNEIYTGHRFLKMLEYNCPIQFYDVIGRDFS